LKINTYQVVPMTSKVGIIEWVENTKPIREIIEEEIANTENKPKSGVNILKLPAAVLHDSWVKSFGSKLSKSKKEKKLLKKY
jgi:DNA-dependent protein kinase catalytic subunit